MDKRLLSPDKVVLDIVLQWGSGVRMVCATPLRFLLAGHNHLDRPFQQFIEPHLDGKPEDGPPPRFVMYRLGPGVWKITPSLYVPTMVHGYLTLVDVPEPAPWIADGPQE